MIMVTPPDSPLQVDVVMPFWDMDRHHLKNTVPAILDQKHVDVTLHLIADGCDFPELPEGDIVKYQTDGNWGPYKIANAVYWNLTKEFMALNDADDISYPDRLWKQVQRLRESGAEMISSSMMNVQDTSSEHKPHSSRLIGKVIKAKRIDYRFPLGGCVNGTRLMRREMFGRVNGFALYRCGMDSEFDNRVLHIGTKVHFDDEVLADRTVHINSLTNCQKFGGQTPGRQRATRIILKNLKAMKDSPTIETARELGGLDKTELLFPIN